MFFILSKIAAFFISPSNAVVFLMSIGVALLFTRYAKMGRRLTTLGLLALLIMALSPLSDLLMTTLENRFPQPPEDGPAPDGIIVLGGAIDETVTHARGRAALNEAGERLVAFAALARRYPQARLVFTGGSASLTGASHTEAEAAEMFFREIGLDPARVIYENRSRNTWENALFTRELVKPAPSERWLLVTSASHMPRSMGIFRRVGFPATAFPVDFRTTGNSGWNSRPDRHIAGALELFDVAMHEWIGLAVYHWTGKTDALFPAP
ncbi:YdcF family protein [Methylosinus sp. Sm6]|uniref:YdcF family protein n=1 Tax=Methylosinus sp. Sm6 TaxID=2866948 RepID=UPI001C99C194|nr:YdcF family protein [Methylosinus sp. Sm6]MBY6240834.1 YdcF family protein [Methylosinus sp. Sm6]